MKTISKILTRSSELRNPMLDLLISMWVPQIPPDDLLHFLLKSQTILALPESLKLCKVLLNFDFSDPNSGQVFELFEAIGQKAELRPLVQEKLLRKFGALDQPLQKRLIENLHDNLDYLLDIYAKFFEPDSASFDRGLADPLLAGIFSHLRSDPTEQLKVLAIIQTSKSAPKPLGLQPKCDRWHVLGSVRFVAPLLASADASVAAAAKAALKMIRQEIQGLIDSRDK